MGYRGALHYEYYRNYECYCICPLHHYYHRRNHDNTNNTTTNTTTTTNNNNTNANNNNNTGNGNNTDNSQLRKCSYYDSLAFRQPFCRPTTPSFIPSWLTYVLQTRSTHD